MQVLWTTTLAYMLRILLAAFCGAIIGFERSRRQKEAGIRTHIIVAAGSALMMIVSKYGFFDVIGTEGVTLDASRIAANVITGISFVGAGMIFVRSHTITGLTTASGIWATSGVGLALGAGMYTMGVFSTAVLVAVQLVLHDWFQKLENTAMREVGVVVQSRAMTLEKLQSVLDGAWQARSGEQVERMENGMFLIHFSVERNDVLAAQEVLKLLEDNPEISEIRQ